MNRKDIVILLLAMLCCPCFARATASKPRRPNAFEAIISNDNPYTYLYGAAVSGEYVGKSDNFGLNIRFQPVHTFALFTQDVLFCGDVAGEFNGKRGPIVVTYGTRSPRTIDGVGCHTLVSVDEVKEKELPR